MLKINLKNNQLYIAIGLAWWILLLIPQTVPAEEISPIQAQNELRLAESVASKLNPGEALWLDTEQDKFLAIYTPDLSARPKGATVILHDANGHPDWPNVIKPLRKSLPLYGWATLSIQLPQLNNIDGYIAYQTLINSRIQKATAHLQSTGISNIVIIGHGSGGMAAAAYLASDNTPQEISGFIGISLSALPSDQHENYLPLHLEKIKLPILDIYGSRDLNSVTNTARQRSQAAKQSSLNAANNNEREPYKKAGLSTTTNNIQGYIAYRQIIISGADHNFERNADTLNKRVLGWLDRHISNTATLPPR